MGKRKRAKASGYASRHGFDTGGLLGHDSTYSVNVTEQVALSVDVVFACVRTIADLTSDADIGEYRDKERLPDSRIVRRPMATVTRRTWVWQVAATMALYNGCYLWDRFGADSDGVALSLYPVAPHRVNRIGDKTYLDGEEIDGDSLRWVPRMTFPSVTRDMGSLLRLAREAIAAAWASDSYRADYWQKGGMPPWYVTGEQKLSNADADTIKTRITDKRVSNPGDPLVLGAGLELKSIGADLGLDGTSAALNRLGTSVARYFGVPPWLVNVPSEAGSLTYSNASAAGLDLVRYTLQPGYAGPIGDAWSDELPGDYLVGRRVVLGLNHLTRGTILEQAQAYAIATGNRAWMIPSEVRGELGLPLDMTLDDAGAPAPALETIGG